jgi:type VI secretion system protein ImpH
LYVGPELDVDVQLVLKASEIPPCQMRRSRADGPRLGWNCWATSQPVDQDSGDAVFAGVEVTWVPDTELYPAPAGIALEAASKMA